MKVVVDLDSHQAIQDFGIRSPAGTYQFKSQDTVEWELYFAQGGVVQDMGASFALKFGMIKTGDTTNTLLAYQTTFTYKTDANGNVYYSGLVNFNTSQMATAIGTSPSIQGTAEIRYQDSLSEIIHTINISTVVYATILVETGVTPPGVSTGYPDASTIELLIHKNAASGYAGLDASSHLNGSVVPVDGQTIRLNGTGQLSSAAILAYTAANFVTPAGGGTVSVTLVSNTGLVVGQYVRIPIAGYYIVQSLSGATGVVLQNNSDPFNALAGVTITSGAALLTAQAAAGGGGPGAGANAFTTTLANFTVPGVGLTVSVNMAATNWLAGAGYIVFIAGAGYYAVSSITDATHTILTNLGYATTNASPGTVINTGAAVSPGGATGAAGTAGTPGANAYDTTTASFIMPAAAANVSIAINTTTWLATGQIVFIAGAGYFTVASVTSPTIFSATNANYPGAAAPGATIASGAKVSAAGLIGPQGAGGAGLNSFTTLTSNFTQPAVSSTVTIVVGTTAWMAPGQGIYIQAGGYYTVSSIGDLTHATVTNLGSIGNAAPGLVVSGSGTQQVSPAGVPGTVGTNAYTVTSANFVAPAAGSSVTVTVVATGWASNGQIVFVAGGGYYQIAAVLSPTQFSLTNLGANYGNAAGGTTVNSGATVSPAGVIGPAGTPGPQGAAGRDGAYSTVYATGSIQGNGGVASNLQLVGDVAQASNPNTVYRRDGSGNSQWGAAVLSAADAIAAPSGGEVSVIQSLASGALALKKLKAGSNVTLTDNGGSTGDILIAASGGGGGGGVIIPNAGVCDFDDFLTDGSGVGAFKLGWSFAGSLVWNAGQNMVMTGVDATNKGSGVVSLRALTASGNFQQLQLGTPGNWGLFVPGLGVLDIRFRVWIPVGDDATTNGSAKYWGIGNMSNGGLNGGALAFRAYSLNNPNFGCLHQTSPGGAVNSSGVAITYAAWNTFQILTDAAWANVQFYINGALVYTATAGIPTAGAYLCPFFGHQYAGGTSSPLNVDYCYFNYAYTRS